MKKILLIEDRHIRQKLFMSETKIILDEYEDILDNMVMDKYEDFEEYALSDEFSLNEYSIVISHKSAFGDHNSKILSKLRSLCEENQLPLVLFSGGIDVTYFDNTVNDVLELNSKIFYSHNLKIFLDGYRESQYNILMLPYGDKWKLNVLANVIELLNIFIEKNITVEDIQYGDLVKETHLKKLAQISENFYEMEIENGYVYLSEIKKFRDSLEEYFTQFYDIPSGEQKALLIHNNNIFDINYFQNRIRFTPSENDIDEDISNQIISEIIHNDLDVIYIKDNLSKNYLELLGLRVAYHIRLSESLGEKRLIPIVIISDFSAEILSGMEKLAGILFTKNIYIVKNNKESLEQSTQLNLENVTWDEYNNNFLNRITIDAPKDYLTHHDISNEWSIYNWAKVLDVSSSAIETNKAKIENMLYFKFLQALNAKQQYDNTNIDQLQSIGKILYIDDEWNKGWSDILKHICNKDNFMTFEYDFKDANKFNVIISAKNVIAEYDPDVVILDLRLTKSDHEQTHFEEFTGMRLLDAIHEVNQGIQVIMLTATSKSMILERLYQHKILGYVKKEHPQDFSINTYENINKFINLMNNGMERKYLKQIHNIKIEIINLLDLNLEKGFDQKLAIFEQYNIDQKKYFPQAIVIYKEIFYVFEILDTNHISKFIYAMVSIVSIIESLLKIFIPNERKKEFWDGEEYESAYNALRDRIKELFKKLGSKEDFDLKQLIDKRNDYLHSLNDVQVSKEEVLSWSNKVLKMLKNVNNPPELRSYNSGNATENLMARFNNR